MAFLLFAASVACLAYRSPPQKVFRLARFCSAKRDQPGNTDRGQRLRSTLSKRMLSWCAGLNTARFLSWCGVEKALSRGSYRLYWNRLVSPRAIGTLPSEIKREHSILWRFQQLRALRTDFNRSTLASGWLMDGRLRFVSASQRWASFSHCSNSLVVSVFAIAA